MMGLLRRFEKRLEKAFEGPFTRFFKGEVHPLEIARRILREMEDGRALGVNEVLAPNRFLVLLSAEDYLRLQGLIPAMTSELEALIIDYATRRDYHLMTRPRLEFRVEESLREGEFQVQASFEEGWRERLEAGAGASPGSEGGRPGGRWPGLGVLTVLSGDEPGRSFPLDRPRTRLGRAAENDIRLADPRVSRQHAEIEMSEGGYILRDLGSTNGTLVGGRRILERLLKNGDVIRVGDVEMRFEILDAVD